MATQPWKLLTIDDLRAANPALTDEQLLSANATWALRKTHADEAGEDFPERLEFIAAYTPPKHPLERLFDKAIKNGYPVTIIDNGRVATFNQGE